MTSRVTVSITVGDRKITLEGPEEFVRNEVERLATMETVASEVPHVKTARISGDAIAENSSLSERELIHQKKPQGHNETVAVLAHCLAINGQKEFSPDDMRRAYLRAGVRPPKVIAQALRDAKNTADYLERGGTRGMFKLSAHGERTVIFDMPRSERDSR